MRKCINNIYYECVSLDFFGVYHIKIMLDIIIPSWRILIHAWYDVKLVKKNKQI